MNVSRWGIGHPIPAALVFVVLCIAGIQGWRQLPIATLPDFTPPEIIVTVSLPGASPSQLETDVTRKVEDAIAGLADIDKLLSTVNEGQSRTRILFELGRDMDIALEEVRDAIDRIRSELPPEIDEPQIARVTVLGPIMLTYAVSSDRLALDELSWFVDDTVKKELFGAAGVGTVSRIGGLDREVRVDLRAEALQAFGLTAGTVSMQLARIQVERAGGRTTVGGGEQTVRTIATVGSAAELADYPISLPDGRSVRLSAIGTVSDSHAEPREMALLNGQPVVGFGVQRAVKTSEVAVGDEVRRRVALLAAQHPELHFVEVDSVVDEARNSYNASISMLIEGALLAVLVVWLFLRDLRATWITALALPLSVIPTFGVMHLLGFSLNLLSLLAMAVVIGILVDDAIVEVENITRHRALGKTPLQAAGEAADEIGIAVIATSATLAAVFVPVAFMPGQIGLFFREFGWTAATAVLFSLLVARLLTPMLAAYFMTGAPRVQEEPRWMKTYLWLVQLALDRPWRTVATAFATFVVALALVPLIPRTFVPPSNESRTTVLLELAPGSTLQDSTAVAEQARLLLLDIPEIRSVFVRVGSVSGTSFRTGPGSGDVRKAQLSLLFNDERKRTIQEIDVEVRRRLSDLAGVRVSFTAQGPGERLELVLAGRDPALLAAASRQIEAAMRGVRGLSGVQSTASLLQPEVTIVPDPARAADLGVSTVDIAEAARIATTGDFRRNLPKLNLAERQIPIRVQVSEAARTDASLLGLMRVPARGGNAVPLAAVATIREGSGPALIERYNRERNIRISGELSGNPLGPVMTEVRRLPAVQAVPPGVRILPSGDAEAFVDLFVGFALAMLTGVASAYVVLLMLFNSPSMPFVILGAIPLCGVGAFGALLVTGYALSLPSLVGLLMLTGVSTKNSILIVDYAILGERAGLARREALLDACHKRARPVIMTTIAMGAGMLPVAFSLAADGNFRAPLGISVIGGLLTSTLLSLLAVPAAYWLVAKFIDRIRARRTARHALPL